VFSQKALLLGASRRPELRRLVTGNPATRRVVDRFVAGEALDEVLAVVRSVTGEGIAVTLDHLGEGVTDEAEAVRSRDAYLALLGGLAPLQLGRAAEVSVKLSAFGQALPGGGTDLALELVRPVAEAASAIGTTVTLDMEESATVDSTLAVLTELRRDHPGTGAVLQAALRRTRTTPVRWRSPARGCAWSRAPTTSRRRSPCQSRADVDAAYARCLGVLVRGPGYPMVGSHDPRMISLAQRLVAHEGRTPDSWEVQMLYGIRVTEQRRLAAEGVCVRAYVPYGADWYGYFMRRLAERPANLRFFLRSLVTTS
jgi:proline dehydrogenase